MRESSGKTTHYAKVLEREKRHRRWIFRFFPDYQYSNEIYENLIVQGLNLKACWLDLGCGNNSLSFELGDHCAKVIGIDIGTHPFIQRDNQHQFVLGDAAGLPFRSDSVDLVTGNMLLEHLSAPQEVFREIIRILKPGGMAIMRTPNRAHPQVMIARSLPDKFKKRLLGRFMGIQACDVFPAFYHANQEKTLRRLCRVAGFTRSEILAVEDIHALFYFPMLLSLMYYVLVRFDFWRSWRSNLILKAVK